MPMLEATALRRNRSAATQGVALGGCGLRQLLPALRHDESVRHGVCPAMAPHTSSRAHRALDRSHAPAADAADAAAADAAKSPGRAAGDRRPARARRARAGAGAAHRHAAGGRRPMTRGRGSTGEAPARRSAKRAAGPGLGQRRRARHPPHARRRRIRLPRRRRPHDAQRGRAAAHPRRSRSRRPTRTCGSARSRTAICRRPGAMRAAASNTAITPTGALAKDADKFERMLEFGAALPRIRKRGAGGPGGAGRRRGRAARRCSRRSSACSTRPTCASATRNTRASNKSFGLTTLRNRHAAVVGQPAAPALSRQERQGARGRARRPARRPRRAPLPGDAGPGAVPVHRRRRAARTRVDSADVNDYIREAAAPIHRQGLPHLARQRPRARPLGRAGRAPSRAGAAQGSCCRRSPRGSATPSRSAEVVRPSARAGGARQDRRRRRLGARLEKARRAGRARRGRAAPARVPRPSDAVPGRRLPRRARVAYTLPTGRSNMFSPSQRRRGGDIAWKNRSSAVDQPARSSR